MNELKKEWVRIDATSAGDPLLQDEEETKGASGDYGSRAMTPPQEEVENCGRNSLNIGEVELHKEERELAQARVLNLKKHENVKEIHAQSIRLPNGVYYGCFGETFYGVESRKMVVDAILARFANEGRK